MSEADIIHEAKSKDATMILLAESEWEPSRVDVYQLLREAHANAIGVMIDTNGEFYPRNDSTGVEHYVEAFDWVSLRYNEKTRPAWLSLANEIFLHVTKPGELGELLTAIADFAESRRIEQRIAGVPVWISFSAPLDNEIDFAHECDLVSELRDEVFEYIFTMATPWGGELRFRY